MKNLGSVGYLIRNLTDENNAVWLKVNGSENKRMKCDNPTPILTNMKYVRICHFRLVSIGLDSWLGSTYNQLLKYPCYTRRDSKGIFQVDYQFLVYGYSHSYVEYQKKPHRDLILQPPYVLFMQTMTSF